MNLDAKSYYRRLNIVEYIYNYCRDREVAVFNKEGKIISKRPETFENNGDIVVYVDRGGYSIHATVEKWQDPLLLSSANMKEYPNLINSYDLVVDIDIKLYNSVDKNLKICQLITADLYSRLERFGFTPSIKFSGHRGFHLIAPLNGISDIAGLDIKKFKEQIYKAYLNFIKVLLKKAIYSVGQQLQKPSLYKKLLADDIIDYQIASWRHMIRVPYSLHEKTGLVSIVLQPEDLSNFNIEIAKPNKITDTIEIEPPKSIKDILLLALGYTYLHELSRKAGRKAIKYIREIPEDDLPPCVKLLLEGVPAGIRNNTMFFLINFFRSLGYSQEDIEKIIIEWNNKNPEPLKDREVEYAIEYHLTRAKYAPYSCEKLREYIGRQYCQPNEICQSISHPLQYVWTVRKLKRKTKYRNGKKTS